MATSRRGDEQVVSVGGHRITLTHLDKVLYPQTGTTKGDVMNYYAGVADAMLPHVRDRPATRKRWVDGVGTETKPGMVFFQKNLDDSTPTWVKRGTIQHKDHSNEYPLVNDLATLAWLGQIAALEIHVPQWKFGRNGQPRNPDRLVLDLDPGPGIGLADCAEVARFARKILTGMGLEPMPVTSGSKGIHLYAPLDGKQTTDEVSRVAHELARSLEADHPELVVSDMKKVLRDGKVFVDWSQNNGNKTTVAPYSLRGRMRPMVAAPRTWRELDSPELAQLDFEEVMKRVKKRGDILTDIDRLAAYRGKRDSAKTPEPVPAARSKRSKSTGNSFVIQEHHASRLHWDFRLEHDGVLVSWALPRGVPTDYKKNHLAVQTEDHPLDYGAFEGDIPKGEYGGGHVDIWDSGTYELEKWRDGSEIIATLHGAKHGTHKYALIHTGGEGKADQNWLIHLMKDQP
jgi:bifunctional non-homologous end joining protein LigD